MKGGEQQINIKKAIEISDAKIQFVSLVDKAANKKQFLITKAEDGSAEFSTYGKILKVDADTHYITGIVYEPLVEDAHGNFMTEDEITKAAYWFAKNGDKVDLQHSFEAVDGVSVVESYIAPCDMEIGSEPVVKGAWVMTVEVTNTGVWDAVQKGDITGFSMGGFGKYGKEDVNLESVGKATTAAEATTEKKGLFKKLAALLGFDVVEKGAMMDAYKESMKGSSFWNAFWALEDILYHYNWATDRYEFTSDEETIREALSDFSSIITDLLSDQNITKSLAAAAPVNKAGKKMSSANKEKLDAAYEALSDLRDALADEDGETIEKEEIDLDKKEIQSMIEEGVTKAIAPVLKSLEATGATPAVAAAPATDMALADGAASTTNAAEPTAEPLTKEAIEEMVTDCVAKALTPFLKAHGLASNLNGENHVEKSDGQHYLAGIL